MLYCRTYELIYIARKKPDLFVLWKIGVIPPTESYEPNAPRGARSVR